MLKRADLHVGGAVEVGRCMCAAPPGGGPAKEARC